MSSRRAAWIFDDASGAPRVLVLGLTGQVGLALLPSLLARGYRLTAVSRQPRNLPGIDWRLGALATMPALSTGFDILLSLGPLDAFAAWYAASSLRSVRIIALGSSGVLSKANSAVAEERALAYVLADAEARLTRAACERDAALTILRPTLIYGQGNDRSLTPLITFARRWRVLPLPWGPGGLRQPVHAEDVAQAVLACLDSPQTQGHCFYLPGGETLTMEQLFRRVLARHAPRTRLLRCPCWLLRLAIRVLPQARRYAAAGFLARWQQDQIFDAEPARRSFGYHPRAFLP